MVNAQHAIMTSGDCSDCRYVKHAFQLINIPLTVIDASLCDVESSRLQDYQTVSVCYGYLNGNSPNLIKHKLSQHTTLIVLHPSSDATIEVFQCLYASFQLTDLYQILKPSDLSDDCIDQYVDHPILKRLVGRSKAINQIKKMIVQVADTDSTVLIQGESGTGKDVIASCIHQLSKRVKHSYIPINCGAIPSELMESELFGHEKGAFTGALTKRAGRFELANDGTLFLDEIGDMPLNMQVKLLRVLQDKMITRVGGNTDQKVNVRIIAATNKNLEELIKDNKFREDLFYRLNVFPIHVPSLFERRNDIPDLIKFYLQRIEKRINETISFTDGAINSICDYQWPGNIRELENFLERMVILHRGKLIDVTDLDVKYRCTKETSVPANMETSFNIKEYISNIEKELIQNAMNEHNGIISSAASYLSIGKKALLEKINKYNIDYCDEESISTS